MRTLLALTALVAATSVHAGHLRRTVSPYTAPATDFIRHLTGPIPLADQACIGAAYAAMAPYLATLSYWHFAPYSREASTINLANVPGKRVVWTGGTYLKGQGMRGDGAAAFGLTGLVAGSDPNISQNNVGIGGYQISTDARANNYIAGINGGSGQLFLKGTSGSFGNGDANSTSGSNFTATVPNGYYAVDRVSDAANILTTKDTVQGTVATASGGLPSGTQVALLRLNAQAQFALLTEAEVDIGAGRSATDRQVIYTATAAALVCLGYIDGAAATEPGGAAFFDPTPSPSVAPLILLRQTSPPASNAITHTTYVYGPVTGAWGRNIVSTNASTWTSANAGQEVWLWTWANRVQGASAPYKSSNVTYPNINDANGVPVRTEYTTLARANAATKATVLYELGAPLATWEAPLVASGICAATPCTGAEDISNANAVASPATYFPSLSQDGAAHVSIDKFIQPPASYVSTNSYAFSLDYEVQDGRPATGANSTDAFLIDMGATIRSYGKKAYLYTNPWDGAVNTSNGFTLAIMNDVTANWDYVSNLVTNGSASGSPAAQYDYGITYLKGASGVLNLGQVVVTLDLKLADADVLAIYAKQQAAHFGGYNLWPNAAPQGGAVECTAGSTNKKIAELLYGSCP